MRLWCLFWQSVKWGGPCGSCLKVTFNGLELTPHRQIATIKLTRGDGDRYRAMLKGGIIFIWFDRGGVEY